MKRSKLLLIFLIFIGSCSYNPVQRKYQIDNIQISMQLPLNFTPQKCLYSQSENRLFLQQDNFIHIYENNKKINTLGGLGFEKNQFDALSDINLTPDGYLLALDSFQKKLKKYDASGKWLMEISLEQFSEPVAFDMDINENLYIYDSDRKEIMVLDPFSQKISFSFGKFKLRSVDQIRVQKERIAIYDRENNITHIYDKLGQFRESLDGTVFFWKDEKLLLQRYWINQIPFDNKLAISTQELVNLSISGNYILITLTDSVRLGNIIFSNR